ncbi:MAG: hypothetical protein WCK47_00620 [bacterium]|nr:hypothetical protein [Candidatus Sumerlaeota bacterium]
METAAVAIPAPELTRLFAPRPSGWLGADGVLSVPLADGRTVWFFGDTMIGILADGTRQCDAMPRNTVAIQKPGPVSPESIQFFLHGTRGEPRSYIRLPDVDDKEYWFWPLTALYHDGCALVFCVRVTASPGICEALSFRVVDPWLARIRVTENDPPQWPMTLEPLPWHAPDLLLSSGCLQWNGYLYMLGVKWREPVTMKTQSCAVLARMNADRLNGDAAQFDIEYLTTNNTAQQKWSSEPDNLMILYRPAVTESTLFYDAPRRRFITTTYSPSQPLMCILTSPELEGPWSEPIPVCVCTEGFPRERHLFYALRMHPHLARVRDEMVLSYVVNALAWDDVITNTDIYFPHFLRLDLNRL